MNKEPKMKYIICAVFFFIGPICKTSANTPDVIQERIIGGRVAQNRTDFPFMVSIRINGTHICGGSIVDYRHVLTAAHCCFDKHNKYLPSQLMSIAAGNLNITTRRSYTTTIKNVQTVIIQPMYKPEDIRYDIAILRIFGSFLPWSRNITPISLANFVPTNSICRTSGWGVTRFNTTQLSKQLLYVDVPVISTYQCRLIYGGNVAFDMICAGVKGSDSCQGDSGGPLVCGGDLVGIVSWGSECGIYPGVYTAVAEYKLWIRQYIGYSASAMILIVPILFQILLYVCTLSVT